MKKLLLSIGLVISLTAAPTVFADSNQKPAYSGDRNLVGNSFGNCVRTKWNAGNDICNPEKPEPVAAPAPQPQIFASKAERTIYFDFDSAEVRESEKTKLNSLAQLINSSTKITDVRVVGYTDQMGSDSYNQKLSQKRVDAVTAYLGPQIRLDIKPESMNLYGAGKASATEECKAIKNRKERIACMQEERRVEIVLNRQYVTH